jgi:hypothetical protein
MAKVFAVVMVAMVTMVLLAPTAHAQIGGIVGDIGEAVGGGDSGGGDSGGGSESGGGGLIGGITDGLEGGNNDSETENESGEGNGLIGGIIDEIDKSADETKNQVEETTGNDAGNLGTIGGTVETVKETLDRTGQNLTGKGGNKKKNDGRNPNRSDKSAPTSPTTTVLGESLADALRADGKVITATKADAEDYAPTGATSTDQSVISQIGRVAAEAVQQAAFPIALILMVAAFLMVQNRIDSKDPKLALAPVDAEHDLLSFT